MSNEEENSWGGPMGQRTGIRMPLHEAICLWEALAHYVDVLNNTSVESCSPAQLEFINGQKKVIPRLKEKLEDNIHKLQERIAKYEAEDEGK
jgi:hypothetical protein